jgi:hypothetical protein
MAHEQQPERPDWLLIFGLTVGALVEAIRLALGHTEDLRNYWVRGAFILGCLVWAVFYQSAREEPVIRKYFGLIEIAVAVASTWYQLTRLAETGWNKRSLSRHYDV